MFPETLDKPLATVRLESTRFNKWQSPMAVVELRPAWDATTGLWSVGWFCSVDKASADEWVQGIPTKANHPWYRLDELPNAGTQEVALGLAARAVRIVLSQIKLFAPPEEALAADELIEILEVNARNWFGAKTN